METNIWTVEPLEYYFIRGLLQRSHSRQAIRITKPWNSFARALIKDEWGRILYMKDQGGNEYIIPEFPVLIDIDDLIGTGDD